MNKYLSNLLWLLLDTSVMKYYKIISCSGRHFDKCYDVRKGGNYKVNNFDYANPKSGIYFSRENILAFLDYGKYVMEVSLPNDSETYEVETGVWKTNHIILSNPRPLTVETIHDLISEGANPRCKDDTPIVLASGKGNYELVQFLYNVHGADLSAQNNYAYHIAMTNMPPASNPDHINFIKISELIIVNSRSNISHSDFNKMMEHTPFPNVLKEDDIKNDIELVTSRISELKHKDVELDKSITCIEGLIDEIDKTLEQSRDEVYQNDFMKYRPILVNVKPCKFKNIPQNWTRFD